MKVKVIVPSSLADIKLSQYQKFLKTTDKSEDEVFINKQLVGIFCNLSDDIVKSIAKKDYDAIVQDLYKVLEQKPTLTTIIKIDGKDYGIIPNIDDITVGEQADIDTMIGDWQKMDKVMAIMYRPIASRGLFNMRNKYTIEDYKEGVSLDLPLDVVFGSLGFFLSLLNDLLSCIPSYIKEEIQAKNLQTLDVSGTGIRASMELLEETFSTLRESLSYDYTRH